MATQKRDIAIVGVACRFPGASSLDEFWSILHEGRDVVGQIKNDRWSTDYYYHPNPKEPGKSYTWSAGLLDGVDRFDAQFFGISPREAVQMDPQQRLLLELAWEALEDGGQLPDRLSQSDCGAFVGMCSSDYMYRRLGDPSSGDAYFIAGSALSIAANRLSYWFNLHGPSMTIDTACSSSLVALHQACQSLRCGESSMALVGGVNLLLSPFPYIGFSKASMLSKGGRCRAFDAGADGYVRAEGGVVMVLKPLDRAEADGDPIRGVILSSAVNADGRTYGLAMPNAAAQQRLLRLAYEQAGVDPRHVVYVEAHGTGTAAGDPQEAAAIGHAIGTSRRRTHPLLIGSVKTNVGHLEPVSGLAGLVKVVLALEHRMIPASLHFDRPNPKIEFDRLNLKVVTANTPLPASAHPAVMGVSSFGFGGANAHVVVREHRRPDTRSSCPSGPLPPLLLSAHSEAALKEMASAYRDLLRHRSKPEAYDICYTAATRRHPHPFRLAVIGDEPEDLASRLDIFCTDGAAPSVVSGSAVARRARLALVFSGNGCQWQGMGSRLLEMDPVFEKAVRRVDALLAPLAAFSIVDELRAAPDQSRLHLTEVAQPALFAVQVGLLETLLAKGLSPEAVVGHSVGDVAAAYAAGALDLEQAVRVIFARSRAQSIARGLGRMAAVGLSLAQANELLAGHGGDIEVAAVNSPVSLTVSGPSEALHALKDRCVAAGTFFHLLDLDYPFHSRAMDAAKAMLLENLADLRPRATRIPFVSATTGLVRSGEELGAEYWWMNVREPVRFDSALAALTAMDFSVFLEIGPHPILQGYVRETLKLLNAKGRAVPTLDRTADDAPRVLEALCTTYALGCPIDFNRLFPAPGDHASLPRYPWQRESYWYPTTSDAVEVVTRRREHPLLGYPLACLDRAWENEIDTERFGYLRDHVVDGVIVFPVSAFVEMALAASAAHFVGPSHEVEALEIRSPLVLVDGESRSIRFYLSPDDGSFSIRSRVRLDDDPWTVNVVGRLLGGASKPNPAPLASATNGDHIRIDAEQHYRSLENRLLQYGPAFRGVAEVSVGGRSATTRVVVPASAGGNLDAYYLHPCLSDAICQALFDILDGEDRRETFLPVRIERAVYYGPVGDVCHGRLHLDRLHDQSLIARFQILDESGNVRAELSGVRFQRMQRTGRSAAATYGYRAVQRHRSDRVSREVAQPQSRRYLLLADEGGDSRTLADELTARLRQDGDEVITVTAGAGFEQRGDDQFVVAPHVSEDFHRLCATLEQQGRVCGEAVHLVGFTFQPDSLDTDLVDVQRRRCESVVHLVQAITTTWPTAPRLSLITSGASVATVDGSVSQQLKPIPSQAAVWGLGRVLMNEHPNLHCRLIDLHRQGDESLSSPLAAELREPDDEDEVVLAGDDRYVMRLEETSVTTSRSEPVPRSETDAIRLEVAAPRSARNLKWRHASRREPGPGELEIRVRATALNYRDVMYATGLLSDESVENGFAGRMLGLECAGIVERLGADVTGLSAGDSVMGFAPAAFGSHVITPAWAVTHRPPEWTDEAAATVPVAFFTAYYALHHVARLEPGEKVLIHGGAGGVGLAAIQYALWRGGEVFATAGSDEKREFLRGAGVAHVLDSRTLMFADEILELTNGSGVDVVLNSLSGEAVRRSLKVLRPFGRFVELGKRDYYENTTIGLRPFRNNISYFGVDVDQLLQERPALARRLFAEIMDLFRQHVLRPLPYHVFPACGIADAFYHMQASKQIGKIVVSGVDRIGHHIDDQHTARRAPLKLSPEGTYLITGGLSGLGLATAHWMVQKGARHLALITRTGGSTAEARQRMTALEASGAVVHALAVDVADERLLEGALGELGRLAPPVRGVVHAAGIVENALIRHASADHLRRVMRPKMLGAANLDRLTRQLPLDFFVLYSSATTCFGSPGQAAYVAANAYLDCLAQERRRHGLLAVALSCGPVSDVGYLARERGDRIRLMAKLGGRALTSQEVLDTLEQVLTSDRAAVALMNLDWRTLRQSLPSAHSPKFSGLGTTSGDALATIPDPEAEQCLARLAQAELLSTPELERVVATLLAREFAHVLQMPVEKLDTKRSVHDFGLDSLMAVELETAIHGRFGVNMSIIEVVEGVTIDLMAVRIAKRIPRARSTPAADVSATNLA